MPSRLVIGLGNRFRRDDGAGLEVVRRLAERPPEGLRLAACEGGLEWVEMLRQARSVVLIDAMRSGAKPGRVRSFAGPGLPRAAFGRSSHSLGLAEGLELARSLGFLAKEVVVIGIEGADFSEGVGLSREVEAAAGRVARRLGRGGA